MAPVPQAQAGQPSSRRARLCRAVRRRSTTCGCGDGGGGGVERKKKSVQRVLMIPQKAKEADHNPLGLPNITACSSSGDISRPQIDVLIRNRKEGDAEIRKRFPRNVAEGQGFPLCITAEASSSCMDARDSCHQSPRLCQRLPMREASIPNHVA